MTISAHADMTHDVSLPDLARPVAAQMELVSRHLEQLLPEGMGGVAPVVYLHLLQAGGKRLRPLLTLLSCQAAGGVPEDAVGLAGAVEVIHLASLVHDDVIDEAQERRGRPSARNRWGNRASILVGDLLIAEVFRRLADELGREALGALANAVVAMCQAELGDSEPGAWPTEEAYLDHIHGKTAALMGAACEVGARAAGNGEALEALRDYGLRLGLAFQICDDLLDLYGDPARLGKPIWQDLAVGNWTLPVIAALEAAGAGERAELLALLESVKGGRLDRAGEAARAVAELGGRSYAELRAETLAAEAAISLAPLPESAARGSLVSLTQYVVRRGL